jgi:hypothetical protein
MSSGEVALGAFFACFVAVAALFVAIAAVRLIRRASAGDER